MFIIRTERLNTFVGSSGRPERFATRREAQLRAAELQDATPSRYGKLVVTVDVRED